jgi:hypothetical protein
VIDTQNGLATPSGVVSVPTGLQTPDEIQLKKERKKAIDIDFSNEQRPLYTVLSQKEVSVSGSQSLAFFIHLPGRPGFLD